MKLSEINRLAREHRFSVSDLDWSMPVDRSKLWAPIVASPVSYLPSFNLLTDTQKLRYNQLFGLGVCEQFIWFEKDLLSPALQAVRKFSSATEEMKEALGHFIEEEEKHGEMFWRTLQAAEPSFYPKREFKFFRNNLVQTYALKALQFLPRVFLAWIWVAVLFEERTLDFSRQYTWADRASPGSIDFTFLQSHRFHLKDEVRHQKMDEHLVHWLYDGVGPVRRKMAATGLRQLLKSYTSPRRTTRFVLDQLGLEFPELRSEIIPRLLSELPHLKDSEAFQQMSFSKQSIGRTLSLIARYSEFDSVWPLMKAVSKDQFKEIP